MALATIARLLLFPIRTKLPLLSIRRRFSGHSYLSLVHPYLYSEQVIYPPRCSSSNGECNWIPPQKVSCITRELLYKKPLEGPLEGDAERNICVRLELLGTEFDTEQELFEFYIKTLACALGGSEEAAKKKIYLVSCGSSHRFGASYGFGAQFNNAACDKLHQNWIVGSTWYDSNYNTRKKDPKAQSAIRFTPLNKNCRLANMFSYHHLSEPSSNWRSDHWLINIKEPDNCWITDKKGNPVDELILNICIKMLAEVVGSEEAAMKKIYIIWCKLPFGFGAEIDEETADKLRGLANVQKVLPDYAFDIKGMVPGYHALYILPSSRGLRFNHLNEEISSDEQLVSMAYNDDERDSTHSCAVRSVSLFNLIKQDRLLNDLFSYHHLSECTTGWDSDHWLIHMKRPNDGFKTEKQIVGFCIQILAEVIGRSTRCYHGASRLCI